MSQKGITINGAALRHARLLVGLSANDLADELEVTRYYVSNLEAGRKTSVSPALFKRICTALCIEDPRVLMRVESIDEVIQRLVDEAPALSEYQRDRLIALLEVEPAK